MAEVIKAFCFPGQGPQDQGLLSALSQNSDYQNHSTKIMEITGVDIFSIFSLSEAEQNKVLRRNEVASLLTVLCALGELEKLQKAKIEPDYLTGYSVGQYVALYAAGCFNLDALFALVWQRCVLMNEANEKTPGRMAAIIGLPENEVQTLCLEHNVEVSNYNARGQYTIAGTIENLEQAVESSLKQGAHKSILINTEGAWHSSFMDEAEEPFKTFLEEMEVSNPKIPVIDNVTGEIFEADDIHLKQQLVKHITHPVQWEKGVRTLMSRGVNQFIEVGYGNMLSKFGFFISRDVRFLTTEQALKVSPCAA